MKSSELFQGSPLEDVKPVEYTPVYPSLKASRYKIRRANPRATAGKDELCGVIDLTATYGK